MIAQPAIRALWILIACLVPNFCLGAEKLDGASAVAEDAHCRQQPKDPFDLGWRFSPASQEYAGKCLNTSSVRALHILAPEEGGHLRFANFYHAGKFWEADWAMTDAPSVQYFGVHFSSGVPLVTAGHTELHFHFPHGLRLRSQTDGETAVVKDAAFSWEATFPPGAGYNIFTGALDNFALSGRAMSLADGLKEQKLPDGEMRPIDIYDLALSRQEGALLFANSVRESAALGPDEFYLTLGRNCTSMLFDMLDKTLQATRPAFMKNIERFVTLPIPDPILGPARNSLIERELITPEQKTRSLISVEHAAG